MEQQQGARHGIVVGVDGSAPSRLALRTAADLARLRGSRVTVVHTWGAQDADMVPGVVHTHEMRDRTLGRTREVVDATLGESVKGLDVAVVAPQGAAGDVLVELSFEADMVVLGVSGHGRLRHALLGSVTAYCTKHAGCPVLVVPDRDERERRHRRHRDVLEDVGDRVVAYQGPAL